MTGTIISGAIVIVQLIFLEGILSLDNAAVLGAMVSSLPDDRLIPWPVGLTAAARPLDRLFGPQRTAALRVGLLGAYAGRSLMLILAAWVMRSTWLKLIGALYLLYLAIHTLGASDEDDGGGRKERLGSFWRVVLAVEMADLAFSLDNVVAATALSNDLPLVILGVAMGILMMRFAAGIFANLVQREPVLEAAAYILVLNIGVELLLEGVLKIEISDIAKFAISVGTLALAIGYAHLGILRALTPLLAAAGSALRLLNGLIGWIMLPLRWLLAAGVGLWRGKVAHQSVSLPQAPEHQIDAQEEP